MTLSQEDGDETLAYSRPLCHTQPTVQHTPNSSGINCASTLIQTLVQCPFSGAKYKCCEGGVVQRGLQRERALGDERGESRSSANDDHLCLIAVIGGERPLKERQESFTREREMETSMRDCLPGCEGKAGRNLNLEELRAY